MRILKITVGSAFSGFCLTSPSFDIIHHSLANEKVNIETNTPIAC